MTSERWTFDDFPPDEVRLPVCEWLRHHGIDPNEVAVPGWIERWPQHRRIVFETYVLDDRGRIVPDEAREHALREARVVQLEAEPSMFPDVVYAGFVE